MEESVLNYVKHLSITEVRSTAEYNFAQIRVPVDTLANNGVVRFVVQSDASPARDGSTPVRNLVREYKEKCFFIALSQGLERIGYPTTPLKLIRLSRFRDLNRLVDTDLKDHRLALERLSNYYPKVHLAIHIGSYDSRERRWFTTPDGSVSFGDPKAKQVVRILNKGAHFEFITTDHSAFMYQPRTMTSSKLEQLQQEAWNTYQ